MLISFTSRCQIRQLDVAVEIALFIAVLAGLLWFLAPQRAIAPDEKAVVVLYAFQGQVSIPGTTKGMGMVMAGAFIMTLPVIAIFFFAQRYFLRGVTLTGLKG